MIIKYSDKFESVFYAVLCANITGYFLVPKSQPQGLFEEEEFIDIDKANWQQIINDHNQKFGDIKWFNNNQKFYDFRDNINLVLRFWQPFKYKAVIDIIKLAIKFGLVYLDNDDVNEIKYFQGIIKQVNTEIILAAGYTNFMPASKKEAKFLLAEYNEESRIGDLVLKKIQQKYFNYNFILRTPKYIYLSYQEKMSIWPVKRFDPKISLAKLLEIIYREYIIKNNKQSKADILGLDFLANPSLAFG